jgi:hypothetical protein
MSSEETTLETYFRSFSLIIGKDVLLEALRINYSDICSNTDLIVQAVIEALAKGTPVQSVDDYDEVEPHIAETILQWADLGYCDPDPSW